MSLTARIYFVYGMVSRQPDSNLKFLHICTSCPTGHVYGPGRVHRPCRAQVVAQCVIVSFLSAHIFPHFDHFLP
jgi:hypothetical protein